MRTQGWAEAEKAKAQRKPAAMREHEQIFGQAPSNVPVFEPKAGGTQKETTLYVGVVFDRTAGTGKVTLTVPKLDGSTEDVDFEQAKPCHMIAVPLMQQGIVIKNITAQSKGYILISTSD